MEAVRVRRTRAVPVVKEEIVEEFVEPVKPSTPPGKPTETEMMFLPQPSGGRVVELTVEIRAEVERGNVTEKMLADWVQRALTHYHWHYMGYIGKDMEGSVVRPLAVTRIKE